MFGIALRSEMDGFLLNSSWECDSLNVIRHLDAPSGLVVRPTAHALSGAAPANAKA
jgi:hypothetical protein